MKTSPTQQIVKLINEQPNLRAGEIIKTTGIEDAKVYRTLSYLVKTKKLNRRAGKYTIAYGLPMTAITPEEKTKIEPPTAARQKAHGQRMRMLDNLLPNANLEKELQETKDELHKYAVKYYDAKAVIKYLAQKLADGNA